MRKITKKSVCFSCRNFRPVDERTGFCRVDRDRLTADQYPVMQHEDSCARWQDGGQQYYIRVGWLKRLQNSEDNR